MLRKYEIILSHGEVIETDFYEAYSTYKAVCIRNNVSPMDVHTFARSESICLDRLIFKKVKAECDFTKI